MIFYFNGDGSAVDYVRSEVYQGSHNANSVYFVGPFSSDCQVTAKFRLEDGEETSPQYFTLKQNFSEALFNQNHEGICVWEGLLTQSVTKVSGTVRVQFTVISLTDELATETVTFRVKKGIVGTNVQVTDINVFEEILQIVSGIQNQCSEASNKLTKVSTLTPKAKAYIKEANGDQNMLNISEDGVSELVKRKQDGNITAGSPSLGTDATSKAYVDNNFYSKTEINSLLNEVPSQEQILGSTGNYNLIEKIIVGYNVTTSEPLDWRLNYSSYFINSGTTKEPVYTNITGATSPTWEAGKYYYYSSQGISSITRKKDTNGNNYNFKKLLFFSKITKSIVSAYIYNFITYGNSNMNYFSNQSVLQTSSDAILYFNEVIDKKEVVEFIYNNGTPWSNGTNNVSINYLYKKQYNIDFNQKINGFFMSVTGNAKIPSGSEIYIYGE